MRLIPLAESLNADERSSHLQRLEASWQDYEKRPQISDQHWLDQLSDHLRKVVDSRIDYIHTWLEVNTGRFRADTATFHALWREFEAYTVALKAAVQLCGIQCAKCQLLCPETRHHEGPHSCSTSHRCPHRCHFANEHNDSDVSDCGLP